MIEYFSIEFWIVALFFISFCLIFFVFLLMKRLKHLNEEMIAHRFDEQSKMENGVAAGSSREILEMLEPVVEESRKAAVSFDRQISEKKRLIKELNEALDSRIISINLLLSRADALQKKLEKNQEKMMAAPVIPEKRLSASQIDPVLDQQNQIIDMYNSNMDIDTIARQLSIPKGEIQLVIDLKKKFLEMEGNDR